MSAHRETDADRIEKLATRLEEIGEALLESEEEREALVEDVIVAMRRYGTGTGFYAKRNPIQRSGVVSVSRHIAHEPIVAVFRPDEPAEIPSMLRSGPSPVARAELGLLLGEYADDLTSMARSREAVYRDLIRLVANEPECLFTDTAQKYGKVYFRSRLAGMEGTTLVQTIASVSTIL